MTYHLNEDVSYCLLDGRLFFLDIHRDRYFQLSRKLERCFINYLENPDNPDINASQLIKYNLFSQTRKEYFNKSEQVICHPNQSVLEMPIFDENTPLGIILDVFLSVIITRWQMKTRRLKPILNDLIKYRSAHALLPSKNALQDQSYIENTAAIFNRVRPYVPIEMCCLIDSLSMVRFLSKQGLHSHLVMAIASDPFSAHAWVQHDQLILNDTVGNTLAHVPIRVI